MKKILSVLLTAIMIFSLAIPVFSADLGRSEYPVIKLGGNGEEIYDENGNEIFSVGSINYDASRLADDVVEVCMPHLLNGIASGDYTEYYDAFYKKICEIYGNARLDENGEVLVGSNVSKARLRENENNSKKGWKSSYGMHEYHFYYDWRIDPWELADRLNDYINAILANSKKSKVSIYGRCIGGTPIIAYLAKYGSSKLDTVCLDSVVSNGGEMISDVLPETLILMLTHC